MSMSKPGAYFLVQIIAILFIVPIASHYNSYLYNYFILLVGILFISVLLTHIGSLSYTKYKINVGSMLMYLLVFIMLTSHINSIERLGVTESARMLYPAIVYYLSYVVFSRMDSTYMDKVLSTFSFIALVTVLIFSIDSVTSTLSEKGYVVGNNWSNIGVCIFIFSSLSERKTLRYAAIVLILIIVAFALKRSAVLFLTLVGLLYFVRLLFARRVEVKVLGFIRSLLLIVATFSFLLFLVPTYYIDRFWFRITNTTEDGGAGRADMIVSSWNTWIESGYIDKFFGLGYRSLNSADIISAVSTHNDYFDFLLSYGYISLVLFLILLTRYVIISLKMIIKSPAKVPFYVLFLSAVLTYSVTSGIFFFSVMFTILFVAMAYIDCDIYRSVRS